MFNTIATNAHLPEQRLHWWNEAQNRFFPGMTFFSHDDFKAAWSYCFLDDMLVAIVDAEDSRVTRQIRSETESSSLLVHMSLEGHCTTSQRGVRADCSAGSMTICSGDEPYELEISSDFRALVIECPINSLGVSDVQFGQVWGATFPVVGLLRDFVVSLTEQQWQTDVNPMERATFKNILAGLIRRCLELPVDEAQKQKDPLLASFIEYIQENLDDSSLRTAKIAQELAVSPRKLQMVLAEEGTTPSQFILNMRLAQAAEQLRYGVESGSVAEIAHASGFADSSHFIRRFKRRFGVSPLRFAQMHGPK